MVWDQTSLSRRLSAVVLEVNDPVYVKRKRYLGYWLADVFKLSGIKSERDDIWVFSARDGYQARITAAEATASEAKPFLAIRDMDASEGWERIQQGKERLSPGPFYLVWQLRPGVAQIPKLPWPYQLAEIRIRNIGEAQEKLFPKTADHAESVTRGFEVFQRNCLACHSLNLEGGVLGPELNIPKNILEYRERKQLKKFVANPSSFRAGSKMPAFGDSLSSEAVDDLFDYLAWMGKHKCQPN